MKKTIQNRPNSRGFLIIEVLLGIVILAMIFLTLFSMISFLSNRTERSKYDSQASSLLQEGMEIARNTLLSNWTLAPGVYHPVLQINTNRWTLKSGPEAVLQGRFTRELTVSPVCRGNPEGVIADCGSNKQDAQSKLVTVTITWKEVNNDKSITANLILFHKN